MSEITAVILCGGRGERLRPFTEHLPKALVPLNGRPILHHLMAYLTHSGVKRFVLCTGYKAECIEQFVRDQCDPEWDVRCVNSGDATMTQRMRDAWPHVREQALVCYGDTLANVNVSGLQRRHRKSGALATISLYRPHNPFGVIKFDRQRRVRSFAEKPRMSQWVNIGFILCETPAILEFLQPACDMVEFLDALTEAGKLFAYEHSGKHITINTEKERQQAENEVVEFLSVLDT
jgi:glucose-1-phosphate cytidylyltransferase